MLWRYSDLGLMPMPGLVQAARRRQQAQHARAVTTAAPQPAASAAPDKDFGVEADFESAMRGDAGQGQPPPAPAAGSGSSQATGRGRQQGAAWRDVASQTAAVAAPGDASQAATAALTDAAGSASGSPAQRLRTECDKDQIAKDWLS